MAVSEFLEKLGLSQYTASFGLNDIDDDVLPLLTREDLIAIGVTSIGHQKRILVAAQALKPQVAPEVQNIPEHAERRLVTMLFVDLVGFSTLAERLDPEDLSEVIELFRGACRSTVAKYKGTIVNFMGDGIMAAFGYPQNFENDSARGVDAAIELIDTLQSLRTPLGESLPARAGLNSGVVVVGELANKDDVDKIMVIGTAPNRAARIQGLAEPGEVLISETTRRLCRGRHRYEDRLVHQLKGIEEPVRVWRALPGQTYSLPENLHELPNAGRAVELHRLNALWEDAISQGGDAVLIEGVAGIGKSRLLWAFKEEHLGQSFASFDFTGRQLLSHTPYNTLNDFVLEAAGVGSDTPPEDLAEKLAQTLDCPVDHPELVRLLAMIGASVVPSVQEPPAGFKEWYFSALKSRILRLAAGRPFLVTLEDTHWSDPTSREFFADLIGWCKNQPALLICAGRPRLVDIWPEAQGTRTIQLEPMSKSNIEIMLQTLPETTRPTGEKLKEIIGRSGGNPYFALELARSSAGDRDGSVPNSLLESLVAQIDRVADARSFALQASCIGQRFSANLLARVMDRSVEQTKTALEKLTLNEIILPDGDGSSGNYTFRHSLVQETAYEVMLRSQRREVHGRIADNLTDEEGATPEIRAYHYSNAGQPVNASRWWYRGAEAGLAVGGYREVMHALQSAKAALEGVPNKDADAKRIELQVLTAIGSTLITTAPQASTEIKEAYDAAYLLAQETQGTPETGPVLFGLAVYFFFRGELSRTQTLCSQLVELAQKLGAHDMARGAMLMNHQTRFWRGQISDLVAIGTTGLPPRDLKPEGGAHMARYAQDPQVTSRITHVWAQNLAGRHERAEFEADWALEYAKALDHPFTLAQALQVNGWHHIVTGDAKAARNSSHMMLELANKHGMLLILDIAMVQSLWAKDTLGETTDGYLRIAEILDRWIMTEAHLAVRMVTSLCADLAIRHGQEKFALTRINAVLGMPQSEDRVYHAELTRLRAKCLAAVGASKDEITAEFDKAVQIALETGQILFALKSATDATHWAAREGSPSLKKFHLQLNEILENYPQVVDIAAIRQAREAVQSNSEQQLSQ